MAGVLSLTDRNRLSFIWAGMIEEIARKLGRNIRSGLAVECAYDLERKLGPCIAQLKKPGLASTLFKFRLSPAFGAASLTVLSPAARLTHTIGTQAAELISNNTLDRENLRRAVLKAFGFPDQDDDGPDLSGAPVLK